MGISLNVMFTSYTWGQIEKDRLILFVDYGIFQGVSLLVDFSHFETARHKAGEPSRRRFAQNTTS